MNSFSTRLRLGLSGAAIAGISLACSAPAFGQTTTSAPQATAEDDDGAIPDIIVTAQRVRENIQDVPIAITAVTGDRLLNTGTTGLENLRDIVPSVSFRKGTTSANSSIFLRGVGTITFSVAAEPSVSTVVDGIVLSRSGQQFIDVVDVDRIEILRGPQGTLFGKNASAGLINIVSRGGTDHFTANGSVEAYQGGEFRVRGSIAGPLANDLTGRFTSFYGRYDGNITNINGGRNDRINGYEHYGFRGVLDYTPGTSRFRLIADIFKANDDCCADVTGASRGTVLDAELGFPVALGEEQRTVNHNLVTQTYDQQWSITGNADFDVLHDHTLSLIAGYRNWRNTEIREGDFLPRPLVGTTQLHDNGLVVTDQYSFEARLASDQNKPFFYQVGGIIWYSHNSQDFTRLVISCSTTTLPTDAVTGGRPCNLADTVNTIFATATSRSDVDSTNYAIFGQATWRFTDYLSVTGGIRWTRDELSFTHVRAPGINSATGLPVSGIGGISNLGAGGSLTSNPPGNGTNTSTGDLNNSNVSGKVSIQFQPTDDLLFYGSWTRGYKGPAFNVFFNHVAPQNAIPIDEETSNSYEVGFKSEFLDRHAQLNAAIYQVTYDGYQANNFVLLNGVTVSNLANAGQVRSQGVEVDALLLPVDGLTLRGSLAYADARVRRFNPNPTTNAPDARNGTRLALAPEWSWNIGADYEREVAGAMVYFSTSYNYVGSQFSDLGQVGPIGAYGLWNASIGIGDRDDTYRITFIARNIADVSYVQLNLGNGQRYQIPRDADRYVGVQLRFNYR